MSAAEAYLEPYQKFQLERFSKIVNSSKPSIIFSKSSILDV